MTLKMRAVAVMAIALAVSAIVMAACGGPTTTDIIQTSQAEERNLNATRTAEAGGGGFNVGQGSAAERARTAIAETAAARAANTTATVEGGGNTSGLPYGDLQPEEVEGEAQTGEVVIEIGLNGVFDPEMVKVTTGTTVTWETAQRTASSTKALDGQEESWNSGPLSRGAFDPGPKRWSRTFEIPGCFQYRTAQSGQSATGAVCVVE